MSGKLSVEHWIRERLNNCFKIAASKVGRDREGWLEDAFYFTETIHALAERDRLREDVRVAKEATSRLHGLLSWALPYAEAECRRLRSSPSSHAELIRDDTETLTKIRTALAQIKGDQT